MCMSISTVSVCTASFFISTSSKISTEGSDISVEYTYEIYALGQVFFTVAKAGM